MPQPSASRLKFKASWVGTIWEPSSTSFFFRVHWLRFVCFQTSGGCKTQGCSTFAREESKLCSFICPQLELGNFCYLAAKASVEDANFALLFFQPYLFLSPTSNCAAKHPGPLGLRYYSCSRQADVQEAVRAAQMPTTGNAFAIQNLSKSLRFQLIGVRVRQQCLTHRA